MWLINLLPETLMFSEFWNVLIIIIADAGLAYLFAHILRYFIGRYIKKYKSTNQRWSTVAGLLRSIVTYVVAFWAMMVILREAFHIDANTLLAGAGVLGIAVGFGAQSLVKDVIAGFFFLVEEQYSVGDLVTIEGFTGTVWELGLRSTTLSNAAGDRFTIPNGSISKVTNHSRLTRGVAVRCSITHETDLTRALAVLDEIARNAYAQADTLLLEMPNVQGVSKLDETGVTLQMFCKCAPGNQFQLERNMLACVKTGFAAAGIDIPYHRLVVLGEPTPVDHGDAPTI